MSRSLHNAAVSHKSLVLFGSFPLSEKVPSCGYGVEWGTGEVGVGVLEEGYVVKVMKPVTE